MKQQRWVLQSHRTASNHFFAGEAGLRPYSAITASKWLVRWQAKIYWL